MATHNNDVATNGQQYLLPFFAHYCWNSNHEDKDNNGDNDFRDINNDDNVLHDINNVGGDGDEDNDDDDDDNVSSEINKQWPLSLSLPLLLSM